MASLKMLVLVVVVVVVVVVTGGGGGGGGGACTSCAAHKAHPDAGTWLIGLINKPITSQNKAPIQKGAMYPQPCTVFAIKKREV
jgi:hypothetical protein